MTINNVNFSDEKERKNFIDRIIKRISSNEKERKLRLLKLILREIVELTILFFLIKGFILFMYDSDAAFLFFVMILGACWVSIYDFIHTNKLFKNFIKSKCSNIVSKFLESDSNPIEKTFLVNSNLFGFFQDVNVDDGFRGEYNDVNYRILETMLSAKSPKGFDIPIFIGVIILFDFNKKILKDTIITRKKDDNIKQNIHGLNIKRIFIPLSIIVSTAVILAFLSTGDLTSLDNLYFMAALIIGPLGYVFLILGVPFLILHFIQQRKFKMEKTKMEDIVFNKDYIIHTKDPIEARYLITTGFLERYLKLQKIFRTKNIKCSFFGKNKLMFAIPTKKDQFEFCNLFTSLNNTKYIEKFYDDIINIIKIVDVFKLNEKTGL